MEENVLKTSSMAFYSRLWNKPTMTRCLFSNYMNTPTYLEYLPGPCHFQT